MTVELNEEWIDFEKIFSISSSGSIGSEENSNNNNNVNVNTLAYMWYVLGKLIGRKPDEYKNKLRGDKSLELWIVGELERMIN